MAAAKKATKKAATKSPKAKTGAKKATKKKYSSHSGPIRDFCLRFVVATGNF